MTRKNYPPRPSASGARSLLPLIFLSVLLLYINVSAAAQGGEPAVMGWGLAGLLFGVSILLIAVGALVVLIRLARLLERLEEYLTKKK